MALEELVTPGIRRRLASLKRALCAHLVGRGLSWVVLAGVAAVFVTLAIDRALNMDRAQRALITALALAGVGYVLWRFLVRPLRVPMDPEELALVLEKHYPKLDDRLISTLQFATRQTSRTGASEELIRQVARQAGTIAETLDATEPIESKRTWKRMGLGGGALCVLVVFTVFHGELMGLWFRRNILLADVAWPKQTYLRVEGGPAFTVVRGEALAVTVTADPAHVVPRQVTFHMDFPGLGMVSENIAPSAPEGNQYIKVFDNVADAFRFHVTGNDDRTAWCRVSVVDPPMLEDVSFRVEYPAYMNRAAAEISSEHGVLLVPAGSRIIVSGRSNKELAEARLLLDGQDAGELTVRAVPRPDGSGSPARVEVEGALALPERIERTSMVLRFRLTDMEGHTNPRGAVYNLRIDPDRAPTVSMDRRGVRGDVTARATVPLDLRARDDHGVAGIEVAVEPLSGAPTTQPATQPATSATTSPRSLRVDAPRGEKTVAVEPYRLELEPMHLHEGQLIRVRARVWDTLPESFGGPNSGESPVQTFKVVSEDELLAELVRREREIRQEFTRAVAIQGDLRDGMNGLRDRMASAESVDQEARRVLTVSARDQRAVSSQSSAVLLQLVDVLEEMKNNRVGDPADEARLANRIIEPLEKISKKPMLDVAEAMAEASKDTDVARMRDFTTKSAEVLDEFHKRLEIILNEMKQLESRQELARALKQIIEKAKQVEEELRQQTGKHFDQTTQPSE